MRNIEPGQTFTSQDAVFVMSDRLTVKAQVDETDIAKIALKQGARGARRLSDQSMPAHVDQIAYDAKTVSNVTTYEVDVLPETTPAFMRSGMTVSVAFQMAHAPRRGARAEPRGPGATGAPMCRRSTPTAGARNARCKPA